MDFRSRFNGGYLLGDSDCRVYVSACAAAGKVEDGRGTIGEGREFIIIHRLTSIVHRKAGASLLSHKPRVCPKPARNASVFSSATIHPFDFAQGRLYSLRLFSGCHPALVVIRRSG